MSLCLAGLGICLLSFFDNTLKEVAYLSRLTFVFPLLFFVSQNWLGLYCKLAANPLHSWLAVQLPQLEL